MCRAPFFREQRGAKCEAVELWWHRRAVALRPCRGSVERDACDDPPQFVSDGFEEGGKGLWLAWNHCRIQYVAGAWGGNRILSMVPIVVPYWVASSKETLEAMRREPSQREVCGPFQTVR